MSWTISTGAIPAIPNLEKAAKVWAEGKPWKNGHASWRPLDGRKRHMRIVKLGNDVGYECVLYDTALVTYRTDGTVVLRTYDTQSSVCFAACVAPLGCATQSHKGRMFWKVRTPDGDRFYQEGPERLILRPVSTGVWELITQPAKHIEQTYDPKRGAAARRIIAPYCRWYELTARLTGQPRLGFAAAHHVDSLLAAPLDTTNYPAFLDSGLTPLVAKTFAYTQLGVYTASPAPFNRLPRITA